MNKTRQDKAKPNENLDKSNESKRFAVKHRFLKLNQHNISSNFAAVDMNEIN